MAKQVPLDAPWRAPKAAEWDSQTVATWINKHTPHRRREGVLRADLRGRVGRAARGPVAAALPLLHPLRRRDRHAHLHRAAAPSSTAIVGGSQQIAISAAERLGDRILFSIAGAADHRRRRVRRDPSRRRRGPGRARDRRDPADPDRPDRLPPAAARLARPAHPADPPRLGDQVHGRLRRAVLAGRGFSGQVTSTDGPVKVVFDNTPPGLEHRRAARLPRRRHRHAPSVGCRSPSGATR